MTDEMIPARLRVLSNGREIPIRPEASFCTPWIERPVDGDNRILGLLGRSGQFRLDLPEPFPLLLGWNMTVEHLDNGESFMAIIENQFGPIVYFRSASAPTKIPEPDEKKIKFREWL